LNNDVLFKTYDLRTTTKIIYESLYNNEKARQWFPTIYVIHENETVNIKQLESDGIEYVARITETIAYSSIKGTIKSLKDKSTQDFEWTILENKTIKKWSRLTTKIIPNKKQVNWISPLPSVGIGIGLIAILENGFTNMSSAYASSTISSSLSPISSVTTSPIEIPGSSIGVSKISLTAIMISTIAVAGGGIAFIDGYYSEPLVEFYLSPPQLPSELHGTSLIITNVLSSDDKSSIVDYDCNVDSVIYDLEYTFDCFTENSLGNKEVVKTTVSIKGPSNMLESEAVDCVSQHSWPTENLSSEYPYLLKLPNLSPSRISELKQDHINLMDTNYEKRDYASAKKHATIILKYFNVNDLQSLSTLGNLIRDSDRQNLEFTKCAIAITFLENIANPSLGL
jgi:hypothetical protein